MGRHTVKYLFNLPYFESVSWIRGERGWRYRGQHHMAKNRVTVEDLKNRHIVGGSSEDDPLLPTPEWMFDQGPSWRVLAQGYRALTGEKNV